MTATLTDAIEAAKQREQIARWDAAEARLLDGFEFAPPKTSLSADVLARLDIWGKWTASKQVRKCPAKSHVVAKFVIEQSELGASPQIILALVDAIAQLHLYHELSNPTVTPWVHHALNMVVRTDPPRSWPREDRVLFATLDPAIRRIIADRERDRDRELRRLQNAAAEVRKKRHNGADETVKHKDDQNEATL